MLVMFQHDKCLLRIVPLDLEASEIGLGVAVIGAIYVVRSKHGADFRLFSCLQPGTCHACIFLHGLHRIRIP